MTEVVYGGQVKMSPRADCETCSWAVGSSAQAEDRAKRHAQQRGHNVRVITEQIEFYQPAGDRHA